MSPQRHPLDSVTGKKDRACRAVSCGQGLVDPLLVAVFVIAAATLGMAQEVSIVVLVNDDPISDYDIAQRERFLAITTQEQPSPELKKKATDQLIDERLQM